LSQEESELLQATILLESEEEELRRELETLKREGWTAESEVRRQTEEEVGERLAVVEMRSEGRGLLRSADADRDRARVRIVSSSTLRDKLSRPTEAAISSRTQLKETRLRRNRINQKPTSSRRGQSPSRVHVVDTGESGQVHNSDVQYKAEDRDEIAAIAQRIKTRLETAV
jgi:hypothetical protein